MSTHKYSIVLEVQGLEPPIRVALPVGVFAPPAEQLRWDAFRVGYLKASDWTHARAYVEPHGPRKQEADNQCAFILTLRGGAKPVRQVYRPGQLQRAQLFLTARLPAGAAPRGVAVYWRCADPLPIPLAPLTIPVTEARRRKWVPCRELSPIRLAVAQGAREQLAIISTTSLTRSKELGGALLGRISSPDEMVIESAVAASDDDGSSGGFRFDSRFWAGLAHVGGGYGRRIVGWFHSHLCDQGHPSTLSELDVRIMHRHFAAPWLVTALVCASARQSELRWFHWQDGAVVERNGLLPEPPSSIRGSTGDRI